MEGYFEDARSLDNNYTQKYPPFYILMNGTALGDPYPVLPPHWHYYVEIIYVTEGTGQVILNGQSFVVNKDDVMFALPRDVHSIRLIQDKSFNYVLLKFDPDMLFDTPEKSFILKNISPIIDPIDPRHKVLPSNILSSSLLDKLKRLLDLFKAKDYAFDLMAKAMILELFYDYLLYLKTQNIALLEEKKQEKEISMILPAYEYIHDHFRQPISAKDVSEQCHLSYSYFSRVFKKLSGISFTKYLNFMRITEAEKLLLHEDASVTKVSYDVGFSDTSYFIKQFKSFKNLTPTEYIDFIKD